MKTKDLIEELQKLPQDAVVFLSSDEEGNSFNKLSIIDNCLVAKRYGEFEFFTSEGEDTPENAKPAIILFP